MATRRIKQYQSGAKKGSLPGMANRAANAGNAVIYPLNVAEQVVKNVKKRK
ncbi:hypothetical protein LSI54_09120 [Nesterenkonia sp. AY15]|uniref:hypothetical protein n=1 Tax=Nesterenkonia sp. AY15 TaxID=2901139 RepID=UPI001F4CF0CC|nr:hypothetical protein [Nesterenkonia sp. AY15]MCH8571511.1 hypothetical protein [Nesterenkonia sp. AY15]